MLTRRTVVAAGVAGALATGSASVAAATRPRAGAFPKGFLWGAATAGHQVEGNNINSDMWVAEHVRPTYFMQPSGDACDSLNRWPDDLDLVRALGLNSYRFSIEWSRIEPAQGQFSQAYLDFYSRMIDGCLKRGIHPVLTFNHFTVPAWFAGKGHWANPEASDLFARFCERAAKVLADRISYAVTINEPNSMRLRNWLGGPGLPPGLIEKVDAAAAAAIGAQKFGNFLLNDADTYLEQTLAGHAKAYQAIKAARGSLPVGVCLAVEDDQAVGEPSGRDRKRKDVYGAWFEAVRAHGDFVGVQTYTRRRYDTNGFVAPPKGALMADLGMEYYPEALGNCVRYVHEQTGKPILVTENGITTHDDKLRARYIPEALSSLKHAIDDGVPVKGYIHWSLIDNFEWMLGFSQKFGLATVDPTTFKRTPKPSAFVLARIAKANALV
jgi:beta-glucosidase